MRRFNSILAAGLLCGGLSHPAQAFSLLGPFPAWQTAEIGYQLGDLGGPMNLGEEYRYNIPLLTYAFDPSFLNYFGERGVIEVEKAIAVLNSLPDVDLLSPEVREFPLDTRRFNHQASALGLVDIKSYILPLLLEQVGLAPAERYVWTLRGRTVINNIPYYSVIRRNFDPVTGHPSSYVNGSLYTYTILQTYTTPTWEAVEQAIDPTRPHVSSVSAGNVAGGTIIAPGYFANNTVGLFYTGLTRDDVAGLRYLYREHNYNVETPPTNAVVSASASASEPTIIDSGSGGNPWGLPGGTNAVGTNALPVGAAVRPGVGLPMFTRVEFDSVIGFFTPVTNRWTDRFITNSVLSTQVLERTVATPDIVFAAADLGLDALGQPVFLTTAAAFENNEALNRGAGSTALDGPGTMVPGQTITLSKLGWSLFNTGGGGEIDAAQIPWWSAYDGTTNEPVVFPLGTSIEAIEDLIASGAGAGSSPSPWNAPPLLLAPAGGNLNTTGQAAAIGAGAGGAGGGGAGGGGGTTP